MTDEVRTELIEEGCKLDSELRQKSDRLKEVKSLLVKLEPGEYRSTKEGSGRKIQVISPKPAIKPNESAIATAKEVAGEFAAKLFYRVTTWKPVENFRSVVAAVLTPAKAQKVITACEVPGQPYVIFQ